MDYFFDAWCVSFGTVVDVTDQIAGLENGRPIFIYIVLCVFQPYSLVRHFPGPTFS